MRSPLIGTALLVLLSGLVAAPSHARRLSKRRSAPKVTPLTVLVTQRTDLYARPGKEGGFVGTAARSTRLPIMTVARGRRCKQGRWFEVATGAWMCAAHGRTSWRLPSGRHQPIVRGSRLVPRIAYYARRDGVPIFTSVESAAAGRHDRLVERGFSFSVAGWKRIGKRRFIQTRNGELVPRADMYRYRPSDYVGRHLKGRPSIPLGCSTRYKYAPVREAPSHRARRIDRLKHHSWVQIHEVRGRGKGRFYRIEQNRWVAAAHVQRVHISAPPKSIGPNVRWVEVLLRHQTLVAYEGARPVFATLVSTGRWHHQSPRGLFRARTKVAMAAMNNRKGAGELYRVDDVPWIQYFHEGFALHGTYWHNGFGQTKSHGCINLAPKDARWLFDWAPPRLRPGWLATQSSAAQPGLLIRIRRSTRQQVRYRGPKNQEPTARPSVAQH
jgi:L,D-transpeptidase-like protein